MGVVEMCGKGMGSAMCQEREVQPAQLEACAAIDADRQRVFTFGFLQQRQLGARELLSQCESQDCIMLTQGLEGRHLLAQARIPWQEFFADICCLSFPSAISRENVHSRAPSSSLKKLSLAVCGPNLSKLLAAVLECEPSPNLVAPYWALPRDYLSNTLLCAMGDFGDATGSHTLPISELFQHCS